MIPMPDQRSASTFGRKVVDEGSLVTISIDRNVGGKMHQEVWRGPRADFADGLGEGRLESYCDIEFEMILLVAYVVVAKVATPREVNVGMSVKMEAAIVINRLVYDKVFRSADSDSLSVAGVKNSPTDGNIFIDNRRCQSWQCQRQS